MTFSHSLLGHVSVDLTAQQHDPILEPGTQPTDWGVNAFLCAQSLPSVRLPALLFCRYSPVRDSKTCPGVFVPSPGGVGRGIAFEGGLPNLSNFPLFLYFPQPKMLTPVLTLSR